MPAAPGETRIGWVGTGVMGLHMAKHVINNGYSMTVYNRTASKAEPLVELGATLAPTLQAVAQSSDIICMIIGYPSEVENVISGEEGLLKHMKPGGIIVDMTTSSPSLAIELSKKAAEQGNCLLDGPVSGGDVGAKNGTLSVMLGANSLETIEFIKPVIQCFAKTINHLGKAGSGQHCKVGNQITIATKMIGVCEGLLYAQAAGLDIETYLSAIGKGAASSFSLINLAPRILQGNLDPGFFVEHFVKDLGIAIDSCKHLKLCLPGLGLAHQLYVSLLACGDGRLGTHALIKVLERLNNQKLKTKDSFSAW